MPSPTLQHKAITLVAKTTIGDILWTDTPISFFGAVDNNTGEVIDRHHPLCGKGLKDRILVIPGGRGSCAGSGGILEMIHAGCAPAALIFSHSEVLVTLGVWVAQEMFNKSIPVLVLGSSEFLQLQRCDGQPATITQGLLEVNDTPLRISLSPSFVT